MQFKTGDILLFDEHPSNACMSMFVRTIKCCTCSNYSHSALVIVDPPFAPSCKGVFVWESSWHGTKDPQDSEIKFGVQLTSIDLYIKNYPGSVLIYRRTPKKSSTRNLFSNEALLAIHKKVYKHKYDTRVKDWCSALFRRHIRRQTDVFTCSAFVSFVLAELGVLAADTDWTIISAADISSTSGSLEWLEPYSEDTANRGHGKSVDTNVDLILPTNI